jgi:hypothetical protein
MDGFEISPCPSTTSPCIASWHRPRYRYLVRRLVIWINVVMPQNIAAQLTVDVFTIARRTHGHPSYRRQEGSYQKVACEKPNAIWEIAAIDGCLCSMGLRIRVNGTLVPARGSSTPSPNFFGARSSDEPMFWTELLAHRHLNPECRTLYTFRRRRLP